MSGGALYDWFDARCIENMPEVARIGCCHQLVHTLSTLIGLGIPRAVVSAFVEETLDGTARLMAAIPPGQTMGQSMDAVLEAAARGVAKAAPDQPSEPD